MTLVYILLIGNTVFSLFTWSVIKKEQERNRILQAFIAGLVRSVSDYVSATDKVSLDEMPEWNAKLPIPYGKVMEAIEHELLKDVPFTSVQKYGKWLTDTRQLFNDTNRRGDGFVFMNYDLFDNLITRWHSSELMIPKENAYLSEEVKVTKDNLGELQGEIAMYKDLLAGELDNKDFTEETIDSQLSVIFKHLKSEHRSKLKQEILKKI